MTTQEASKILKMLLGYLKGEIEPPKQETIEEARAFEQEGLECLNMAIRSLEAWEKVKEEIEEWHNKRCTSLTWNNYKVITEIIDKHLKEVENDG